MGSNLGAFRRTHLLPLAAVAVACAARVFLSGQIERSDDPTYRPSSRDHFYYRPMALASPGLATVERPYTYRILVPWVAGLLPMPVLWSFHVLAVLFTVSLAVLFYLFLCDGGIQPPIAAVTCSLFVLNKWFVGKCLWNCFHAGDLFSLNCFLVGYWALLRGRWAAFGVAMLLGTLTRETALILIPVGCVVLAENRRPAAEWAWLAATSAASVACFALLRLLIPAAGGMGLRDALATWVQWKTSLPAWSSLSSYLIRPYTPLALLPLVCLGTTLGFLRERKHAVVLFVAVFLSSLFGADVERLMAPTFVVFYPLIAVILQRHVCPSRAVLALIVGAALGSGFSSDFGRYRMPSVTLQFGLSVALLAAVTVAVAALRIRAGRARQTA